MKQIYDFLIFKKRIMPGGRRLVVDLLIIQLNQIKFFQQFFQIIFSKKIKSLAFEVDRMETNFLISNFTNAVFVFFDSDHVRLDTYIKKFQYKKLFLINMETLLMRDVSTGASIQLLHTKHDWLLLYFLQIILNRRGFSIINYSLSDLKQYPLRKLLSNQKNIWFDCYDPYYYYTNNWVIKFLLISMYSDGCSLIVRDLRIKRLLNIANKSYSNTCYVPDTNILPIRYFDESYFSKRHFEKIGIVSSGFVSARGNEGILDTVKLINSIIPNLEFHFCLSKNLDKTDPHISELVDYIEATENFYIHQNLHGEEYLKILDKCHFGFSLHDKYIFNEPYDYHTPEFLSDCPSSRVIDYAARGLILITTPDRRLQKRLFRNVSTHGIILDFHRNITHQDFLECLNKVKFSLSSKGLFTVKE